MLFFNIIIIIINWLVVSSEKYEFVSWDHYSQHMEIHQSHVPNHQPEVDVDEKMYTVYPLMIKHGQGTSPFLMEALIGRSPFGGQIFHCHV